jgi:putative transcriptional regulator
MKNKVKEIREELGISQEELSEKSRVSRTTISGLENETIDVITNITLEKIAGALGRKVPEVFFQD